MNLDKKQQIFDQVRGQVNDEISERIEYQGYDQVWDPVRNQVYDQIRQVQDQVYIQLFGSTK